MMLLDKKQLLCLSAIMVVASLFAARSFAQEAEGYVIELKEGAVIETNEPEPAEEVSPIEIVDELVSGSENFDVEEKARLHGEGVDIAGIQPILLFLDEYRLIQDARRRARSRPATAVEVERSQEVTGEEEIIDPGRRELVLAGIVYRSEDDWTIWFNEQRVAPDAIPEEILDLKVFKNHIEVKWFDEYTNQIFPIRLKPHQRFNLDSRIFLPG